MHLGTFAKLDDGCGRRRFVKIYEKNLEKEFAKANQIYEVSLKSGFFAAPRPLVMLPEHSIILWEYYPNLVDLRSFLLKTRTTGEVGRKTRVELLRSCGRSLASLHSSLKFNEISLVQDFKIKSIGSWPILRQHLRRILERSDVRYLHGDFGCANIFVSLAGNTRPKVVITDASPNRFLNASPDPNVLGTIYLDLALFIGSLNSRALFYFNFWRDIPSFAEIFIKGYEEVMLYSVDRSAAFAFAAESLFRYREYQKNRVSRLSPRGWWEWRFRGWSANRLIKSALAEFGI